MSGSFVLFAAADRGTFKGSLSFAACARQIDVHLTFSTRNITADVLKIEDGKDRLPLVPRSAAAIRYDCDRTVAPGSMARSHRVASFFHLSRARRLVNRPNRRSQRRVKLLIRHVHPQTLRQRATEAGAHPAARSQPPRRTPRGRSRRTGRPRAARGGPPRGSRTARDPPGG